LALFCVWTKSIVCKDDVLQRIPLFRRISEDFVYKLENLRFPVSRPDDRAILSGCPSDHCSIRPNDVPYCPDASQTKHHPSGRRAFPSEPSTMSRSFYLACISLDNSAARPDAYQYLTSFIFFPSSNMGKTDSTVRTMWYPVRTRVSLRQESQFKYHHPDVSQPWFDARSTVKEIADSTSTVRTSVNLGPDTRIADMEIAC